jgi:hypothetical protein
MKFKFWFVLFLAFFAIVPDVFCQKFIILQKGSNEKTRLKYEIGEWITYKTNDFDFFITDVIRDIQTDIIVLSENVIRPENIIAIDIYEKDPRNSTISNLSFLSYGAAVIFFTADAVNSIYIGGNFSISRGILISSTLLAGTGFALSKMKYRYFKIGGRNKIQLINLYGD